jgi:hypothetical protein
VYINRLVRMRWSLPGAWMCNLEQNYPGIAGTL